MPEAGKELYINLGDKVPSHGRGFVGIRRKSDKRLEKVRKIWHSLSWILDDHVMYLCVCFVVEGFRLSSRATFINRESTQSFLNCTS